MIVSFSSLLRAKWTPPYIAAIAADVCNIKLKYHRASFLFFGIKAHNWLCSGKDFFNVLVMFLGLLFLFRSLAIVFCIFWRTEISDALFKLANIDSSITSYVPSGIRPIPPHFGQGDDLQS